MSQRYHQGQQYSLVQAVEQEKKLPWQSQSTRTQDIYTTLQISFTAQPNHTAPYTSNLHKMCGYFELAHSCCGEKYGFIPSEGTRCTYYNKNNRYCRTGSVHSWVVEGSPITTSEVCENCKKGRERDPEFKSPRSAAQIADEEDRALRARIQKAREERTRERELRRIREEEEGKSAGGRNDALAALRSQLNAQKNAKLFGQEGGEPSADSEGVEGSRSKQEDEDHDDTASVGTSFGYLSL